MRDRDPDDLDPARSAFEPADADAERDPWDAYLTTIEDRPASVLVNLAWADREHPNLPWLHQWVLPMGDPGPAGLGSLDEARGFDALESEVTDALAEVGFVMVGRERHDGRWKLSYYASSSREASLREVLAEHMAPILERVVTGVAEDAAWSYYYEVLCPDLQQRQWIYDRDQILALREEGLEGERRVVEHLCYFSSESGARNFVTQAEQRGFACEIIRAEPDDPHDLPWMVRATRRDELELGELHVVTMTLLELADKLGGGYEGWALDEED